MSAEASLERGNREREDGTTLTERRSVSSGGWPRRRPTGPPGLRAPVRPRPLPQWPREPARQFEAGALTPPVPLPSQAAAYRRRHLRTARCGWRKVLARSGYFALSANFSQRVEEGVDADRIELVARSPLQLFDGGVEASRRPVRARLAHGDERIGGRDDAGAERRRRPFEAVGISTPVPALN